LSRDLPRETVALEDIRELDESFWAKEGPRMTCRQVAEHCAADARGGHALSFIFSSCGRVMDGMHRLCKALLLGQDAIETVRFMEDPDPDYIDADPDNLPYVDSD
jgi:hypothetical protein